MGGPAFEPIVDPTEAALSSMDPPMVGLADCRIALCDDDGEERTRGANDVFAHPPPMSAARPHLLRKPSWAFPRPYVLR